MKRVRVTYNDHSHRVPRVMVADLLSHEDRHYHLSGRPEFGTVTLDERRVEILSVEETTDSIHRPRATNG